MNTSETWKPCKRFPAYEVSNHGRVKRRNRILSPWHQSNGYLYVSLYKLGRRKDVAVHTLVLNAFVGRRPTRQHQCAHADGNRENNALSNVRWATPQENARDRAKHGHTAKGQRAASSKLKPNQVKVIKALKGRDITVTEIGVLTELNPRSIANIWEGKTWAS